MELAIGSAQDSNMLRAIAKGLAAKAAEGNLAAIRQVADRLDGRPPLAAEISDGPSISHEEALAELE
jgi:hypothetical protein